MGSHDGEPLEESNVGGVIHTPLKTVKDIRLLTLQESKGSRNSGLDAGSWTMDTFTLESHNCPPYKALSYTWGSPIFTRPEVPYTLSQTINCNGQEIRVGQNLYDALEQLRVSGSQGYIWIDALCINQEDTAERDAQVLFMGKVYASATEVIVWLGKDSRFLSDVIWLHNQTALLSQAWQHLNEMNISSVQNLLFPIDERTPMAQELLKRWQGYWQFFECRTWFRRAWIVQEVILARNIEIWCGKSQLPYDDMDRLLKLLRVSGTIGLIMRYADTARGEASPNLMFRLGMKRETCRDGLPNSNQTEIGNTASKQAVDSLNFHTFAFNLVNIVRTHRATFAKDKVYSFLGILELFRPNGVAPIANTSYSSTVEDIYTKFTFAMIERMPSLEILSEVEDKKYRKIHMLPSWVPDYTYDSEIFTGLVVCTAHCHYRPITGRSISRQPRLVDSTLMVSGFRIDAVTAISLASGSNPAIFEWENPSWFEYLEAMVDLANPAYLSHHYTSPAPAVLCRTILANSINGYPAPDSIEHSFLSWLVYMVASPASMESLSGQPGSEKWETFMKLIHSLKNLISGSDLDNKVPWKNIMGEISRLLQTLSSDEVGDSLHALAIVSWKQKLTEFNMAHGIVMDGRKLFRTGKGLLGLGAASVKVGDEVWAIENGQMLMVLRPCLSNDSRRLMEFVGDSYVHGCMRGELFPALHLDMESVEINII